MQILSVSSLACKALGSYRCVLVTSKRLIKLKNKQFFDLSEKRGHRQATAPNERDSQGNAENHDWPEQNPPGQKPLWEPGENLHCNSQIAGGSEWTDLGVKNATRAQSQGASHFCEFYLMELDQVVTVSIRKNAMVLLAGRGGKEPFLNIPEHSALLPKACQQEKLLHQGLNCWSSIRAQPTWENRNTQLQPALAFQVG